MENDRAKDDGGKEVDVLIGVVREKKREVHTTFHVWGRRSKRGRR